MKEKKKRRRSSATSVSLRNRKLIVKFLNKSFLPFGRNTKLTSEEYIYFLLKAAQANTYIETICKQADSFHRRIETTYEENVVETYSELIRALVKKTSHRKVTLAIDFTDEPFYGETRTLHTHNIKHENGYGAVFKYAVLSIVDHEKSLPLLSLPVRVGAYKSKVIRQLLLFAKSILDIRLVLMDRGFYSADVIATFQKLHVKYLILVPKNKAVKRYIADTFTFNEFDHELVLRENKSTYTIQTRIIVVRHYDEFDWTFATNLSRQKAIWYIVTYKKRWQIETNFRVEDEAHIKSKSTNYLVRYFYFTLSLLLHAIWLVYEKTRMPFKAFLITTYEHLLFSLMGIDYIIEGT